jgi:hypothetical protein
MLEPRTHFEQVPLQIVRKIVKEQMRREIAAGQTQKTKKKKLKEDLLRAKGQSIAMSGKISPVEA